MVLSMLGEPLQMVDPTVEFRVRQLALVTPTSFQPEQPSPPSNRMDRSMFGVLPLVAVRVVLTRRSLPPLVLFLCRARRLARLISMCQNRSAQRLCLLPVTRILLVAVVWA